MVMLLITHIIIALASVAAASAGFVRPSYRKLQSSYVLIGATLVSGTMLIIMTQASLLHGCAMGITYSAGVTYLTLLTHRKLAAASNDNHHDQIRSA
jgi:hypothetical protein